MTKKQQNLWIVIAIVVVVLIVVMIALPKEDKLAEEKMAQEEFDLPVQVEVEDLPKVPEVELKEIEKEELMVVAPGASKINEEGEVVTDEGKQVVMKDVGPGSKDAPKQSKILEEPEKEEILENAIELEVSRETGFVPDSFTAKTGQAITILLTAVDSEKYTLRFKDRNLRAVAITVKNGQSRAMTFNAPTQTGTYEFICSGPHQDCEGKMIVVAE